MFKKTIKYTDYNGVERTEDFYFNLSKPELMEMQYSTKKGFAETIQDVIAAQDRGQIIQLMKRIIKQSYGEKSEDGKRFIKSKELSEAFTQTEAYSVLYMELATDDKAAAEFVNGIVPQDIVKELSKTENQ